MNHFRWAVLFLVLSGSSRGVTEDQGEGQPPVTALAVAPSGLLIAGSSAGLQIWDTKPAAPELSLRSIETGLTEIQAISFSPDGRRLIVAGGIPAESGAFELFDWSSPSGKKPVLLQRVEGHSDVITDVAFSSTGKRLVTSSLDATWQLFDLSGDASDTIRVKSVSRIEGHSRGVTSVNFLTDEQIVTASLDSTIRVWNASTGKLERTLSNHRAEVLSTAVRPISKSETRPMLASVSKDRTVRLWQPTIGRLVRFAQLDSVPLSVAWLPNGSRMIVGCLDGSVRLIDPDTAETVRSHQTAGSRLWSAAVGPGGKQIFVGGVSRLARTRPAFWQLDLR